MFVCTKTSFTRIFEKITLIGLSTLNQRFITLTPPPDTPGQILEEVRTPTPVVDAPMLRNEKVAN